MSDLKVIYEDNHLLVVDKPAGIATMGERGESLHAMAAEYLRRKYDKPGRAFVGIVSRLDRVTSGVLVLARTSKAASRLVPQFAPPGARPTDGPQARKIYLAAVEGVVPAGPQELSGFVFKDEAAHRMRIAPSARPGAQPALLRYWTLARAGAASIVAVELLSGRKHQIRAQWAEETHPVWGDRKYGSCKPFPAGVALHSWRLQITHPTRRERMWFGAPLPASWGSFRQAIGDPRQAWRDVARELLAISDETKIDLHGGVAD